MKKDVLERGHKVLDKASLGYIADVWLKTKEQTVAVATYTGYKESYENYIRKEFETKPIKDIEPIDINTFMISLSYKPATIAKIMCTLKQIFDFAITLNYIKSNPCYGIKKPNIRITKKKTWDEKQIKAFFKLSDVKEATCYTAFMILFNTGMRPGEVCGLQWTDYDGECFAAKQGIEKKEILRNLKMIKPEKKYIYHQSL